MMSLSNALLLLFQVKTDVTNGKQTLQSNACTQLPFAMYLHTPSTDVAQARPDYILSGHSLLLFVYVIKIVQFSLRTTGSSRSLRGAVMPEC